MQFSFKARIYKVGINLCVRVPNTITAKLTPVNGYIPIRGTIQKHFFQQTLCPVKNEEYRLYVNGPMLKGADLKVGQIANFVIQQDSTDRNKKLSMPTAFKKELETQQLLATFEELAPFRQKEICRYLGNLKTEEALRRNITKLVNVLRGKGSSPLFRVK